MCGSSKNKQTTKSSQTTAPNAEAMKVYQSLLGRLDQVGKDTYTPYAGTRVAEFTPEQTALLQQMTQPGGAAGGVYNDIISRAGQTYEADINRWMNPYTQSVVDPAVAQMQRGFERDVNALKGNAISAGAFGGDRAGIAESVLRSQQGEQRNKFVADLMRQGYDSASANALAEMQARNAAQSQSLNAMMGAAQSLQQGYGQAFDAADLQRQLNQAKLDIPYEEYLERRAFPYQQLQFMSGIGTGVGSQMGGTSSGTQETKTPGPNLFSQILGAGLGIAGLGTGTIGGTALMALSDERLKENIEAVGVTNDGQTIYKYNFKGDPKTQMGLLAQEVEHHHPEAVGRISGFKAVNYDKALPTKASGGALSGLSGVGGLASLLGDLPMGGVMSLLEGMPMGGAAQLLSDMPRTGAMDALKDQERQGALDFIKNAPIPFTKADGGSVSSGNIIDDAVKMAQRLKEDRAAVLGPDKPAELRAYEPTLRDMLANLLMPEGRASPERRRLVEGLVGSSGLGETGSGIVDLIPGLSQVLNSEDAYRDLSDRGDVMGAAGDVLEGAVPLKIPGVGRAVDEMGSKITRIPDNLDMGLYEPLVKRGGGDYTPEHEVLSGLRFRDLMADPTKTVTPKSMEEDLLRTFDRRMLDEPRDLALRVSNTLNDLPKDIDLSDPKAIMRALRQMRIKDPEKYLSLIAGIPLAIEEVGEGKAEGGAVERNWAGFDPATSRALFTAGMAMMAGRSPFFGPNVGVGGLAGMQSYDDYINDQAALDYKNKKLAQEKELEQEKLAIMREGLKVKPEYDLVKDVVTKDGRPVVLNKATGRYHDASTGQPIDESTGIQPVKKKYSDLPVGVQKEIVEARDQISATSSAANNFLRALELNEKAYAGPMAGTRGWLKSLTEDESEGGPGTATEELDNIIKTSTLDNLKAVFGGMPTEGERKVLMEIQGSSDKAPQVRKEIFRRAYAMALARKDYNQAKARAMIDGTYFTEGFSDEPPPFEGYLDIADEKIKSVLQGSQKGVMRKQFRTKDGSLKWGISKDGGKTWEPE